MSTSKYDLTTLKLKLGNIEHTLSLGYELDNSVDGIINHRTIVLSENRIVELKSQADKLREQLKG